MKAIVIYESPWGNTAAVAWGRHGRDRSRVGERGIPIDREGEAAIICSHGFRRWPQAWATRKMVNSWG